MKIFASLPFHLPQGLRVLGLVLFLPFGLTAFDAVDAQPTRPDPSLESDSTPPSDRCPPNCEVSVFLPTDARAAPRISASVLNARSGARVTINLVDQTRQPAKAATVLRFPGPTPFVNRGGQPMKTVPLTPGRNVFKVRSFEDGVCRKEQGGCKYDVINTGDSGRPVLDPHVIIWP